MVKLLNRYAQDKNIQVIEDDGADSSQDDMVCIKLKTWHLLAIHSMHSPYTSCIVVMVSINSIEGAIH